MGGGPQLIIDMSEPLPEDKTMIVPILHCVASVPSLVGSAYIVQHLIRKKKHKRRVFGRLFLGMAAMDFVDATTTFSNTWPAPAGLGIKLAAGTWASCEAFGFLQQGSRLASVLYNASLTAYYLATIRYGWSERKTQRRLEKWFHLTPLLVGWSTAVAGLVLKLYNPFVGGCYIVAYPFGCDMSNDTDSSEEPETCQRGQHAFAFRLAFVFVWVWLVFAFLVAAILMIYRSLVATTKKRSKKYGNNYGDNSSDGPGSSFGSSQMLRHQSSSVATTTTMAAAATRTRTATEDTSEYYVGDTAEKPTRSLRLGRKGRRNKRRKSQLDNNSSSSSVKIRKAFATQALLYCLVHLITWLFPTLGNLSVWISSGKVFVPFVFLNALLSPLQGFWNAAVYIRPRYLRYRNRQVQRQRRQQEEEQRRQQQQKQQEQEQRQAEMDDVSESSTPSTSSSSENANSHGRNSNSSTTADENTAQEEDNAAKVPADATGTSVAGGGRFEAFLSAIGLGANCSSSDEAAD